MANRNPYTDRIGRSLYNHELDIREAEKRFHETNTFSLQGAIEKQNNHRALLLVSGFDVERDAFHAGWPTIDSKRCSAGCTIEQHWMRLFALGPLFAALQPLASGMVHLTFANPKEQRPSGELSRFKLAGYKRKINGILRALQTDRPSMVAVGMVEISATPLPDGSVVYEPHNHLLIYGVPEDILRAAFKSILLPNTLGHPIRIDPVGSIPDLGLALSYIFKFTPELRTKFIGNDGSERPGRPNLMRGPVLAEWLAWLAGYRVADLLINIGLRPGLMRQMRYREVLELIPSLLKESRRMPPRLRREGLSNGHR